ncbi:MAG: hypothetical protein JRC86_13140 [Deltaproteobacteria bacterium]|nr:hypothetical protein [Deltaproteobacteria bacterium]
MKASNHEKAGELLKELENIDDELSRINRSKEMCVGKCCEMVLNRLPSVPHVEVQG